MQTPPPPEWVPTAGFIVAACLASLPLLGVVVWGAVKILGPVTLAIARRIGGTSDVPDGDLRLELGQVHRRMDALEADLGETRDRLDFTERLLTQDSQRERLGGAEGGAHG